MKELTLKLVCLNLKLYKIGLLIALIYIALNLMMIWGVYSQGNADHAITLLSSLTIMTSILLIYGLLKNRHTLLLPWLANVAVLMLFNLFALIVQFKEAHRDITRVSFYWAFGFFIALEMQIIFWFTIYCLLKEGHRKSIQIMVNNDENMTTKTVESNDAFKVYLVGNENNI